MRKEIISAVTDNPLTFIELQNHLKGKGFEVNGEFSVGSEFLNVLLWDDCSKEFSSIIEDMYHGSEIEIQPCFKFLYNIEGFERDMPTIEYFPQKRLKVLHWVPSILFC